MGVITVLRAIHIYIYINRSTCVTRIMFNSLSRIKLQNLAFISSHFSALQFAFGRRISPGNSYSFRYHEKSKNETLSEDLRACNVECFDAADSGLSAVPFRMLEQVIFYS